MKMQGKQWIQSSEIKVADQLSQRVLVKRQSKRTVSVEDKQQRRKRSKGYDNRPK